MRPVAGAPTRLSVNLNKVALLRNQRNHNTPDLAHAARLVLEAGADGLTVHPRPDGRHIRAADVPLLAALLRDWPGVEYNIEGNPLHELLAHVDTARPAQATFVPDAAAQATSDHGWELAADAAALRPAIARAQRAGARVSLFMDPEPGAMALARELGADRVELYTEPYAVAFGTPQQDTVLARYRAAAQAALAVGLEVNAGHDLNRANLRAFLVAVPGVSEVSIGQALIADALEFGLTRTVQMYQAEIRAAYAAAAGRA